MNYLDILNKSEDDKELNKAILEIMKKYDRLLFSIAYKITGNEENAKDIRMIAFEEMYYKRKTIRSIKPFLTRIAKYRALTYLSYYKGQVDYNFNEHPDTYDLKEYIGKRLLFSHFQKNLSEQEMDVFIEIFIKQLDLKTVAKKCELSLSTVKRINKKILLYAENYVGLNNGFEIL